MNRSSRSSAIRAATQPSVKYPSLRATHPRKPLFLWQRNRWFADSPLEGDGLAFYREINNLIWQPGLSARTEFKGLFRTLANPALRHFEPPDAGSTVLRSRPPSSGPTRVSGGT